MKLSNNLGIALATIVTLTGPALAQPSFSPNDFKIQMDKAGSAPAGSSSTQSSPSNQTGDSMPAGEVTPPSPPSRQPLQQDLFNGPLFQNKNPATFFQANPTTPVKLNGCGSSNQGQAGNTAKPNPCTGTGTGSGSANNPSNASGAAWPFHPVIIRLKRYRALNEMEVVWEASYMANIMLSQGANVTVLLDMDAVHAANASDTSFAGLEPYRGEGCSSSPPLTTPQDQFRKFTANGGKLVANKRWAQIFGMIGGVASSLVSGTQLIDDVGIAQLLLREGTEVIDY